MAQATLNGILEDDGGETCEVRFDWGGDINYGMETLWQGGFTSGMAFNATIYNLAAGSAFHFRAVAKNSRGIAYGNDMVFSTLSPVGLVTLVSEDLLYLLEAAR